MAARGIFELEGSEYWQRPVKTSARVVHALAMARRSGLFLDGPATAELGRVDRVPVLVLHAVTTRDARRYDLAGAGYLVCVRLEDRSVEVVDLYERDPGEDPFAGDDQADAAGAVDGGEGGSVVVDQTDALRLGAAARPGTLLLTALVRDRVSNRVTIRLAGPEAVTTAELSSPSGTAGEPALVVACQRGPGDSGVQLRGTVRVAALAHELAPAPPAADGGEAGRGAFARVPVCLVIVGERDGRATALPVIVPCQGEAPALPGASVAGSFALDLAPHVAGRRQALLVYAFCGPLMTGPLRV